MLPEQKINVLRKTIREHNYNYYIMDDPKITDYDYDMLINQLKELEEKHPEFITLDSPTQKIGGEVASGFPPCKHGSPLLSLDNKFTVDDLLGWCENVSKAIGIKDFFYQCEVKYDGLAINLTYEDGTLTSGATRGDGSVGELITENVMQVHNVRKVIGTPEHPAPKHIEIRGEVVFPRSRFKQCNIDLANKGAKTFANPRNAAAGTLRQLDPNIVSQRGMWFIPYGIGTAGDVGSLNSSYHHLYEVLKAWGFIIPETNICLKGTEGLSDYIDRIAQKRKTLPYDIDGVVVKVNQAVYRKQLGFTSKFPKWAIAYKFPPEEMNSVITGVEFQVGRTGKVTPVAKIIPISVGGVTVSSVTLHNQEELDRLRLRVGSVVTVRRAGDVIPQIVRRIEPTIGEREFGEVITFPKYCPCCQELLLRKEGMVDYYCVGEDECKDQLIARFDYFVSKSCMDIDGIGHELIIKLVNLGIVKHLSDIYTLDKIKMSMVGYNGKNGQNVLNAIHGSKQTTLLRVIVSQGIDLVGPSTTKLILKATGGVFEKIRKLTKEELLQIKGIGKETAHNFSEWMLHRSNEIDVLVSAGVHWDEFTTEIRDNSFKGKTVVVTGNIPGYTRDGIKNKLESLGANVSGSVSKQTDYLFAGAGAGSKVTKAEKLSVPVRSAEELLEMLRAI